MSARNRVLADSLPVVCVLRRVSGVEVFVPARYAWEAEHQDGYGYWDQFTSVDELSEDVERWQNALDG